MRFMLRQYLGQIAVGLGACILLTVGLTTLGEAANNETAPKLDAVQLILQTANRQLTNIDSAATTASPDETDRILAALDSILAEVDGIITTTESIRSKVSGTPTTTGAAEFRWSVNTGLNCPAGGADVFVELVGPTSAEGMAACDAYSLVIGDLPVGSYTASFTLTDGAIAIVVDTVVFEVLSSSTTVVSIDFICDFCTGL